MKQLTICKAESIHYKQVVEGAIITINGDIPHLNGELQEHLDFFQSEADALANALIDSLPQGILIRLTHSLLGHIAEEAGFIGTLKGQKHE
jgi:hypothetical protein